MLLVLDVLLIVFYSLLLRVFFVYLSLYSMYVTMSISIGLYPNLDLWNANKLHYIKSLSKLRFCQLIHYSVTITCGTPTLSLPITVKYTLFHIRPICLTF